MTRGLLLIDIQNDYFPGGRMELHGAHGALKNARLLLDAFRQDHRPIIHIQHISLHAGATFFLPDTPGADIHPDVAPRDGERVFVKHAPNSFYGTGLADHLKDQGLESLMVCGMMTHMCIDTTVRAAKDHGLILTLAGDACATRDLVFGRETILAPMVQKTFLAALQGTFAEVVETACVRL